MSTIPGRRAMVSSAATMAARSDDASIASMTRRPVPGSVRPAAEARTTGSESVRAGAAGSRSAPWLSSVPAARLRTSGDGSASIVRAIGTESGRSEIAWRAADRTLGSSSDRARSQWAPPSESSLPSSVAAIARLPGLGSDRTIDKADWASASSGRLLDPGGRCRKDIDQPGMNCLDQRIRVGPPHLDEESQGPRRQSQSDEVDDERGPSGTDHQQGAGGGSPHLGWDSGIECRHLASAQARDSVEQGGQGGAPERVDGHPLGPPNQSGCGQS